MLGVSWNIGEQAYLPGANDDALFTHSADNIALRNIRARFYGLTVSGTRRCEENETAED
jgi:hypothetical protein